MQLKTIVSSLALIGLASHAWAQVAEQRVEITGSSIKRIASEGALPVQVISRQEITREGIASTDQLMLFLTGNGNGLDNLAANGDVLDASQGRINGASSANLRGQGAASTLVLLNGRRVATYGLSGGVIDLNQIPFSAIERVEVLKDGASAIYGTDAVGGVINFITRRDFRGLNVEGFADITDQGGGNVFRGSVTGGIGDLSKDGFNLMVTLSVADYKKLRGDQRGFTSGIQPERGLVVDTRGAPHGTIMPLAGTIIAANGSAPFVPGSTTVRASGGINVLDLPGGPGCASIDGMAPYDNVLWAAPDRQFACAWDTSRAAVIQQPVQNTNLLARGSLKLGEHLLTGEVVAARVDSAKSYSNIQLLPSAGLNPLRYPRNAASAAVYDDIARRLVAVFPTLAPAMDPNRVGGALPISYRWRCVECGPRELKTTGDTDRIFIGIEGPVLGWEYKAGWSRATSDASSTLGEGFVYRRDATVNGQAVRGLVDVLNTGVINPFILPGQTQSAQALALIAATSAAGTVLYGGSYTTTQADATASGSLFKMAGGDAMAAVGVDFREEKYSFNATPIAVAQRPDILGAPFEDVLNQLGGVKRDVKAVYAELLLPITRQLELTLAARRDDYTGFGATTNPKVSFRFQPTQEFLVRGSYNTAFRVPTFNQIFNVAQDSQNLASGLVDPLRCPGNVVVAGDPNCAALTADVFVRFGGTSTLGPETAEQYSLGFVWEPSKSFSIGADWWSIEREDQIRALSIADLSANYNLFSNRYLRGANGAITVIDRSWINTGGSQTDGLDVALRGNTTVGGWRLTAGVDISYLLKKRTRILPNQPWGPSEIGVNTLTGDLGIRWKHNAFVTWRQGDWGATFSQQYRTGVRDRAAPGVTSGAVRPPDWKATTDDYEIFNVSLTYSGIKNMTLTAGVKNILNTDPPFSYTYDDVGGNGGAWDPRVADPRGRSFTLRAEYRFF